MLHLLKSKNMFKALLHYKYKTIMLLASSTASIIAMFLITAIANGIISMYTSMLKNDSDLIIMQKGVADTFFSNVSTSLIKKIKKLHNVNSVQGVIVGAGAIESIPIAGIYGFTDNRIKKYHLLKGKYPKNKEVIIGETINKLLHNPKFVTLMGYKFHVSGVYESPIGFERGGVILTLPDAQKIFHKETSFLLVSLHSIDDNIHDIMQSIQTLDNNIEIKKTTDFIQNYNQFKIIKNSSNVIAFISFIMGFLSIASLMSLMINDRKNEFGIKRAIGISKYKLIMEIILEVLTLIIISFTIAYIFSVLILHILQNIDKFQGYLSGTITFDLFMQILSGSICMAILSAFVPAFIAAKTDPIILINKGQ